MSAPNRLRVRVPSNFSMRETRRLSTIHTMRRFRDVSRYQHANPTRALANTLSNSSGPSVADKSRERPSFATTSLHSLSIIDRRSNFKAPTCFTGRSAKYHSTPLSWLSAEGEEAKSSEDATTEKDDPQIEDASTTDDSSNSEDDTEPSATDIVYNIAPSTPLSEASQNKVQAIFEKVLWLDMIEVHLLTQVVNEQMGISWKETEMRSNGGGFVQASASGGGGASVEAEAAEEKTIFDLKLIGFDAKAKIKVIKEVRTIAGLGLKEAKEMVEGTPKVIQKELKLDKAEELKAQLEAVGAQVELV